MGDCSLSHPKRNTASRQRLFEIVDNQRWLLGTIDVEFGNLSLYLDLELSPLSGDKVVGWFQVAVNDSFAVRRFQCTRHSTGCVKEPESTMLRVVSVLHRLESVSEMCFLAHACLRQSRTGPRIA
jgi:hypothetical protein